MLEKDSVIKDFLTTDLLKNNFQIELNTKAIYKKII